MARARSDIANTALRIFLQDMGVAYDEERGLEPYKTAKHFTQVRAYFDERCCYCAAPFGSGLRADQDHLIPMNQSALGLHAWGNIVPACPACNSKKTGSAWEEFIVDRAGPDAHERHKKLRQFIEVEYPYKPSFDLRGAAEELYEDVGAIAMTLITAKVRRERAKL